MNKTHVVLTGSKRRRNEEAIRVGSVDPDRIMEVTIDLRGPKLPGADEVPMKSLSKEELAAKYGASKEDAAKVTKALKAYKLKVEEVSLLTGSMRISGKASAMGAAFRPKLATYRSKEQGDYVGREGTIKIPSELKGIVTGVFGLDQRKMARRKGRTTRAVAMAEGLAPLTPADLEKRYNFPPGDGAGQTIAIGEFGGAYVLEDIRDFARRFNLPEANVRWVPVNAPAYEINRISTLPLRERKQRLDETKEVTMDVQIVAGLCPRANISVLFATLDERGWVELLNKVIEENPVAVSVSWGFAEDDPGWSRGALDSINDRLNAVRLLGITACISSGDDGSGDGLDDGRAHVDFPGIGQLSFFRVTA
jgi:kumamolisin